MLRHIRLTKTLSNQRLRRSMLICAPAASNRSAKAALVNRAAWSVLKIFGRPMRTASSSASKQNEVSMVFDRRQARLYQSVATTR